MSLFGNPTVRHFNHYLETIVFQASSARIQSVPVTIESADALSDGSDDNHPLKLEGISRQDFERLLEVLYPLTAIPKTPVLAKYEWISVLKLANLWHFLEVRDLAIQQLTSHAESLDCIERILFARKYDVSAWLRSGYTDLARRKEPISLEEARKIGLEVALQIYQAREAAVMPAGQPQNAYRAVDLGSLFQAELERADSAYKPTPRLPIAFGAPRPRQRNATNSRTIFSAPTPAPSTGGASNTSNPSPSAFGTSTTMPTSAPSTGLSGRQNLTTSNPNTSTFGSPTAAPRAPSLYSTAALFAASLTFNPSTSAFGTPSATTTDAPSLNTSNPSTSPSTLVWATSPSPNQSGS
ncbi:hypothetical protein FB451DRAFT_1549850 [Mycena latifolia]|nr:hypothetical protein FB451DRAFT_1549850 [Mycena latifolia]